MREKLTTKQQFIFEPDTKKICKLHEVKLLWCSIKTLWSSKNNMESLCLREIYSTQLKEFDDFIKAHIKLQCCKNKKKIKQTELLIKEKNR